jgi:N-acetylglucosamine-6-phosphate deacetylase
MSRLVNQDLLIVNARIVTPQGIVEQAWLHIRDGLIAEIGSGQPPELPNTNTFDAQGASLLPGFIDVHVHGGGGYDFMDTDLAGFAAITKFHAAHGTTGLLATTLTASREHLTAVLELAHTFKQESMPYAQVLGVHLEGPFVNVKWKGAQNPDHIVPPQPEWLEDWVERFPGTIKIQTLAPESEGALAYIRQLVGHGIIPSCGHTDATYDQIVAAADCGLRHAVHTFNAMKPLHHREPGTVGAVLSDDRIVAEVIADGHHVHPAAIKIITRTKGTDNVILVTDAMAAAGMPDGDYDIGGLPVHMKCGVARLKENDSLAGSTLTIIAAVRYLTREVGVPLEDASRMASANPARQLGIEELTGSIEAGKRADLVLLDNELEIRKVWIGGKQVD